jgi:hypothetical protein
VTFVVTFATLWKQQHPGAALPGATTPESPAPAAAAAPTGSGAAARPALRPDPGGPSTAAPAGTATPVEAAPASAEPAALELPAEVHFRRRVDLARYQGSVMNDSDAEMVVEVTIYNPTTRETGTVQLSVPAFKAATFGLDDGLNMQQGDQYTLHSAPYRDKGGTIN